MTHLRWTRVLSAAALLASAPSHALPDLAVANTFVPAIFRVDRATGNRTVLSGCASGCPTQVGTGPAFDQLYGMAQRANGALVVADAGFKALFGVDPASGNRTVISGCADDTCSSVVGTGIDLEYPADVVVTPSAFIVTDYLRASVISVDPATGNRTVLSGCANDACSSIVGSGTNFRPGPNLTGPIGAMRNTAGDLFVWEVPPHVNDPGPRRLFSIAAGTGNRTVISGCVDPGCASILGSGPHFNLPIPGAFEAGGTLLASDAGLQVILRIDPSTGNRTVVSGCLIGCAGPPVGSGPVFAYPYWAKLGVDAGLLLTDQILAAVIRVDPATGNRTVISSDAQGSGPSFSNPSGILDLPEPGAMPGLAAGCATLVLLARRRAKRR